MIFGFSLLFVFLILAALYESWTLPFSVLLSTPVAVFGAFGVLWLRRAVLGHFLPPYMVQIENDVYSQIGLVMLIGLAAKNAILIVEFAKDEFEKGKPLADAALEGARLRLRPILMTSFAFILGCVPLWIASGRRRGGPPDHGDHRDRRHAGGERDRHLPDSRGFSTWSKSSRAAAARADLAIVPPAFAGAGRLIHAKLASALALAVAVLWRLHGGPELSAPQPRDARALSRAGAAARRRKPLRSPISNGSRSSRTKLQELIRTALGAELRSARRGGPRRSGARQSGDHALRTSFRNSAPSGGVEINRLSRDGATPLPAAFCPRRIATSERRRSICSRLKSISGAGCAAPRKRRAPIC